MEIALKASAIKKTIFYLAIILISIHSTLLWIHHYGSIRLKPEFIRMFNLDMEANLPTLFSFSILFFSAFLFYLLSKKAQELKSNDRSYYLGLSFVFTFLAFDESIKIHEAVSDLTEIFIQGSGYFNYPWVIPYGILVLVLIVFYIQFFWRMEQKVLLKFILSAVLYVGGAIGFELLGSNEVNLHGSDTVLYGIYSTIEESLEMFGVILLIDILLDLLGNINVALKFNK